MVATSMAESIAGGTVLVDFVESSGREGVDLVSCDEREAEKGGISLGFLGGRV